MLVAVVVVNQVVCLIDFNDCDSFWVCNVGKDHMSERGVSIATSTKPEAMPSEDSCNLLILPANLLANYSVQVNLLEVQITSAVLKKDGVCKKEVSNVNYPFSDVENEEISVVVVNFAGIAALHDSVEVTEQTD